MGIFIEWVKGARSTYEVVDEVLADAGEAVIEGACFLRNKYPNALGGGGILRPVMDRLCSENGHTAPLPPSAYVPFQGGQCCDVRYFFDFGISYKFCSGSTRTASYEIPGAVGRILGGVIKPKPGNSNRTSIGVEIEKCDGSIQYIQVEDRPSKLVQSNDCPSAGGSATNGDIIESTFSYSINNLTAEGGADIRACGDPPGEVPPDPTIDETDFRVPVEICGTPADAQNPRCVTVDIDFDPFLDENGNQCFTIEGQKYCFTPDGVEKQDDETTPTDETPAPDELEPSEGDETEEQEEEDENIKYVTTQVTTLPRAGKSVWHSGTGNNDYFAGYFNWTTTTSTGVYRHPTIPIRKELQIYQKPEDATGYVAYAVNGAKIKVTKYTQPQE
jgi:hypothetical protein